MNGSGLQMWALARRAVVRTLRQPAAIVPAIAFPLFFLAVVSAGAGSATKVPGFPTDSYLRFVLAGIFLQGILLAGLNGATDLAVDVESGFLNRLALTPLRRLSVVVATVVGVMTVTSIQIVVFLGVGLAFGAHVAAGVGGAAVLMALGLCTAAALGALWAAVALATGSSEAVQGAFPVAFVVLGFSSFFFPRALVHVGWFRAVAAWNPASYLIEGMRSLVVTGWDGQALAMGFVVAAGLTVAGLAASTTALQRRLAR
jgi:ABC-2 type transport system permease protein